MKPLITIMLASLALSGPAVYAHTTLSESVPAEGAVLDSAPEEVVLAFSEPVRLTAVSIEQRGGKRQTLEPLPSERSDRFTVAAPELAAGEYVVSWRAVSADTHVVAGEVSFSVSAPQHAH